MLHINRLAAIVDARDQAELISADVEHCEPAHKIHRAEYRAQFRGIARTYAFNRAMPNYQRRGRRWMRFPELSKSALTDHPHLDVPIMGSFCQCINLSSDHSLPLPWKRNTTGASGVNLPFRTPINGKGDVKHSFEMTIPSFTSASLYALSSRSFDTSVTETGNVPLT